MTAIAWPFARISPVPFEATLMPGYPVPNVASLGYEPAGTSLFPSSAYGLAPLASRRAASFVYERARSTIFAEAQRQDRSAMDGRHSDACAGGPRRHPEQCAAARSGSWGTAGLGAARGGGLRTFCQERLGRQLGLHRLSLLALSHAGARSPGLCVRP